MTEPGGDRLEREVRLIPRPDTTVDVVAAAARHGLRHTGTDAWGCASVYLDTPARELAGRDASLSINHAPGRAGSVGWLGFKAGVRLDGVVRHAVDVRHYHGREGVPEVADVLAERAAPVERAAGVLAPTPPQALAAVLVLTQRRTQHRFLTGGGDEVVVSEDDLAVRPVVDPPTAGGEVHRLRLVEIDLTALAGERDTAAWPLVEELIAAGMAPTPLPKYALGLRLLAA